MVSEPFAESEKLAAPPKAVLSAVTMSPIVMPEVSVTLAVLACLSVGAGQVELRSCRRCEAAGIRRRTPVAVIEGAAALEQVVHAEELREAGRRRGSRDFGASSWIDDAVAAAWH